MSMKLTPAAATSTRSSPGPGVGLSWSLTVKTSGPPCWFTTTARMRSSSLADRTGAVRSYHHQVTRRDVSPAYTIDDDPARVDRDAVWAFLAEFAYWGRWRTREIF